jgi:hypothetical protein
MPAFVRVTCPGCGARLRAPAPPPGRTGTCPRCRAGVPLPAGEPEPRPTDFNEDVSAEARALCQSVRHEASKLGQRWLAAYYRAAGEDGRRRITDATRHLRDIHAQDGRGGFGRRRARVLAARIPAGTLREMAAIAESPAGDWSPSGGATLREAFDRFEEAAGPGPDNGTVGRPPGSRPRRRPPE